MEERFNMEKALEDMGFTMQDKERECLSVKGHVAIWYAVDPFLDELGRPVGCVIENTGERIYEGKMHATPDVLKRLLASLHILEPAGKNRQKQTVRQIRIVGSISKISDSFRLFYPATPT